MTDSIIVFVLRLLVCTFIGALTILLATFIVFIIVKHPGFIAFIAASAVVGFLVIKAYDFIERRNQ